MKPGKMNTRMGKRFWGPRIMMFATTRVALGIGVGLLLSRKLSKEEARAAGTALLAAGIATTMPFAVAIACGKRWSDHGEGCRCRECTETAPPAEPQAA